MRKRILLLLLSLVCALCCVTACGAPTDSSQSESSSTESPSNSVTNDSPSEDLPNDSNDETDDDSTDAPSGGDEQETHKTALIRYRLNVDPVEGGNNLVWGEMPDQTITDSGALNTFAFTLTDQYEVAFRGWTTTKGSATVEYTDGATYTVAANGEIVTLYAIVELVWVS